MILGAGGELPTEALFSKLGQMLSTAPLSDSVSGFGSESDDEEAEYIEYIYKPRQYFMSSLCNVSIVWHYSQFK